MRDPTTRSENAAQTIPDHHLIKTRSSILITLLTLILSACGGGAVTNIPAPSALSYASPAQMLVNSPISPLYPTVTGTVSSYSVSPSLPLGLALSTTSGAISGTPSAAAPQATYTISATNASGSTTFGLVISVNNVIPTVSSLSPLSATVGAAAFVLTVNGSNYLPTSTVQWNGSTLPTTFVTASQLTASVPAADIAAVGKATISVANPTPGGGLSVGTLTFTVQPNILVDASTVGPAMTRDQLGTNLAAYFNEVSDPTYVPLLQSAGIGLIRWPGGALADQYHWQTNTWGSCYPYAPAAAAAFDNWMQSLAIPSGADIAITVNYGSNQTCTGPGDPNEAAAWVDHANNVMHYGIKYWTVGNEQYFPETDLDQPPYLPMTYASRVATQFYPMMKAKDPTILVGIDMAMGNQTTDPATDTWDQTVLANAKYDFVEIHYYPQYQNNDSDSAILTTYADDLATIFANANGLLAKYGHANTPIFLGEFDRDSGSNTPCCNIGHESVSIVDALFNAIVIAEAAKAGIPLAASYEGIANCQADSLGSTVSMAYGWQTFGDFGMFSDGPAASNSCVSLGVPAKTAFPKARAYQVLSQYIIAGEKSLSVSSSASSVRAYAATHSGGYAILLINTDPSNSVTLSTGVANGSGSSFKASTLTYSKAEYDQSKNGVWAPAVSGSLGTVTAGNFSVTLTPWSMTLVILAP